MDVDTGVETSVGVGTGMEAAVDVDTGVETGVWVGVGMEGGVENEVSGGVDAGVDVGSDTEAGVAATAIVSVVGVGRGPAVGVLAAVPPALAAGLSTVGETDGPWSQATVQAAAASNSNKTILARARL